MDVVAARGGGAEEVFGWACPTCTLINAVGTTSCAVCGWRQDGGAGEVVPMDVSGGEPSDPKSAVQQIWNQASLDILQKLVGNAADHPKEPKFRGPIRKTNGQIRANIVEVAGAAEVLRLAGFSEDSECFRLGERPELGRLERVRGLLRDQARAVEGRKVAPVKRRMPKFDEDLLREVRAEARYNECRWGQTSAASSCAPPPEVPPSPPLGPSAHGSLRLRLKLPLGGRVEIAVGASTSLVEFGALIQDRIGVLPKHQRLRFGFPPRVLESNSVGSLLDAGIRDGEVVYLEDVRDLFLGNLDSGSFTMAELLDKVPPGEDEGAESMGALFRCVLQAFGIDLEERCFWDVIRARLQLLAHSSPEEQGQLRTGLCMLRRLFHNHNPRERLALAMDCLPEPDARRRGHRSTRLEVDRAAFLASVAPQVLSMTTEQLLSSVSVRYVGERGEDAGGLTRDFFSSFANRLGDDEPLLWELTGQGSLQPVASRVAATARHASGLPPKELYRASGRIFGLAVLHGCKLGRRLSRVFVRVLIGEEPSDLEALQEELRHEAAEGRPDFRGGREILERPLRECGLEGALNFTCPARGRPDLPEQELLPGGGRMVVTDANKAEWLALLLRHDLVEGALPAAEAFRRGLVDVFGGGEDTCPLLCLLGAEDLIELWGKGGVSRQDVSRWRAVANVSPAVGRQAEWLWEVLEEDFDDELRGKVLQFATGSSCMGRDGLQGFMIEPADGSDERLPTAMTCGNMLQLPRYSCRAVLSERLRTAAEDCGSFQMA